MSANNEERRLTTKADTTTAPAVLDADSAGHGQEDVLKFKKRMLAWDNPVEFVNNMYGCHPDEDGNEYFKEVFRQ